MLIPPSAPKPQHDKRVVPPQSRIPPPFPHRVTASLPREDLLETWIYAIAGRQREDLAVIDPQGYFDGISCEKRTNGKASKGWSCIWAPTPHLCHHSNQEVRQTERPATLVRGS